MGGYFLSKNIEKFAWFYYIADVEKVPRAKNTDITL